MSQPTPREVLDQVARRILVIPRGRLVNQEGWDSVHLDDVLEALEETAAQLGQPPRRWNPGPRP